MKVLVSGGNGFIGRAARRLFAGESRALRLRVKKPVDAADLVRRECLVSRWTSQQSWSDQRSTQPSLERMAVD
jgi:hypothetical protein